MMKLPRPATDSEIEAAADIASRLPDLGRYLTEYVMYFRVQSEIPRLQAALARIQGEGGK